MTSNTKTLLTLHSRDVPHRIPLASSGGNVVAFVFTNADDAIAFGMSELSENNDRWVSKTKTISEIRAWCEHCKLENSVTHIAVDSVGPKLQAIPIDEFVKNLDNLDHM